MLKNGEKRQYNTTCPFDCTEWDECVCENTAIRDLRDGVTGERYFFNAASER
jgi:hypothetical protein